MEPAAGSPIHPPGHGLERPCPRSAGPDAAGPSWLTVLGHAEDSPIFHNVEHDDKPHSRPHTGLSRSLGWCSRRHAASGILIGRTLPLSTSRPAFSTRLTQDGILFPNISRHAPSPITS